MVEKFAGYGFNKSHSAAYALVSYQTAWLKAHYPGPFMAAVMSTEMDNLDKVVPLIEECRNLKLTVTPPDVNVGGYKFTVDTDARVVYGLGAIRAWAKARLAPLSKPVRQTVRLRISLISAVVSTLNG